MKIQKLRYSGNKKEEDVSLQHRITEKNYGKYFKTRISRDGYKIKINYKNLESINTKNPVYIELHSPKGIKRVNSSRGFRTYYKIVCESLDELKQVAYQLNNSEIEKLINSIEKKTSRKRFLLWGMTQDYVEVRMVFDINLIENERYKQHKEEFETLLTGYFRENLIKVSAIDNVKKPDFKSFLSQIKNSFLNDFWSKFITDSRKYLEIEVKDFDEKSVGFYVKIENSSYYLELTSPDPISVCFP